MVITLTAYLIFNRIEYRENYFTKMRFDRAAEILRNAYKNKKPFPNRELLLMDLEIVGRPQIIDENTKNIIMVPLPQYYLGIFNTKKGQEYKIKESTQNIYIKDIRAPEKTKQVLVAGYAFGIVILLLLYISVRRSIGPIRELEKKVKKFGEGDFSVDCSSDRKDEIGNLANSFDKSIKKLKALMDGRMLFLRNAAHELKTPLTKGMIALELPDSPKKTKTFKGVFSRLNHLVSELINIEKVTSGNVKLVKKKYLLKEIIKRCEKLLFLEETIETNIENQTVHVDIELFSLALKNLIDNGIKYSENNRCKVILEDGKLKVINQGKKLKKPLDEFLEPFSKETENKQGFGLGLFIVNHILKVHKIHLEYEYIQEKQESIFFFKLNSKAS